MYEDDTTEAHERRITRCKTPTCNARIVFLPTESGSKMPVDADTVEPGDEEYDAEKHVAHWTICPGANKHRKRAP